ncbi:MAG: 16S rRNA (cytosine(1402)-N(4))-methyltransferase RsmH [Neisseriaceae bacterium]
MEHKSVLLEEAVEALSVRREGIYVDATFGRGGHSMEILERLGQNGRLLVIDKDPEAIQAAHLLAQQDKRVTVIHNSFKALAGELAQQGIKRIDGIIFDFGVATPQLEEPSRGFSFQWNGPLDMRMDNTQGPTAAEWLHQASHEELSRVIKEYGEERFAKPIARAIVEYQKKKKLETTQELTEIIARVVRFRERGQHPATRTFQAIRIHINGELDDIRAVLPDALELLADGGRLVTIAFHSLEDRIVKQFIQQYSSKPLLPKWVMLREEGEVMLPLIKLGKPMRPTLTEIRRNPRSRSAIMRVAVRRRSD